MVPVKGCYGSQAQFPAVGGRSLEIKGQHAPGLAPFFVPGAKGRKASESRISGKHATPEHKGAHEIMLEVLKLNENSQIYATPEHKTDRESVLSAEPDNLLDWANPSCVQGLASPEDTGDGD